VAPGLPRSHWSPKERVDLLDEDAVHLDAAGSTPVATELGRCDSAGIRRPRDLPKPEANRREPAASRFHFDVGCPDCNNEEGTAELEAITASRSRFAGQSVILRCSECRHEFLLRVDLERIRNSKGQRDYLERQTRRRGFVLDRAPYSGALADAARR